MLYQRITKSSMKKANTPSICISGTGFGYSMDTESSVQKQDCTRYDEKCAAILSSRKQAWSDGNSLEFTKDCEDLVWNHDMSTPHGSETNGIAERAIRRVKEGTSNVLVQSRSVEVIYETCKIHWQRCKLFTKRKTTLHSVVQQHLLGQRYFIIQFPQQTKTGFTTSAQQVLKGIFF